jgi:hypothetical protein
VAAVTVPVGSIGALDRSVVVGRRERLGGERIADVSRRRLAGAVIAALLDPSA